jgi:antitoxin VapB
MKVVTSRTFRSGNSEAVRLPKEVAFGPDIEVEIVKTGDMVMIRRKPRLTPGQLAEALRALPKPDRVQEREPFEAPDRPGL